VQQAMSVLLPGEFVMYIITRVYL